MKTKTTSLLAACLAALAFHGNAAGLAEIENCEWGEVSVTDGVTRAYFTLRPTPDSLIRCVIALPAKDKWNGRFWGLGSGGPGGYMNDAGVLGRARGGSAAAYTDLGTSRRDFHPPEVIRDFGHRATHLMTLAAKKIVREFYGRNADRCYFEGGSTGGGQGFHEAIRYPDDYDGIVSMVPAMTRLPLHMYFAWTNRCLKDEDGRLLFTKEQLEAVRTHGLSALDGAPEGLRERMRKILEGPVIAGRHVHCGVPPGADILPGAGNQWMLEWWLPKGRALHTVTDDELLRWERDYAPDCNATTENLDAFRARGGKIIVCGGLEDSVVPVPPMVDWFRRVNARYGAKETHAFCRFYLLPGWAHGPGRGMARAPDCGAALTAWVEKGVAPELLPAKMRDGSTLDVAPQW